jgi:esterase/lipase
MAATPIPQPQSRLNLILCESEDRVVLNGLLWEPQKASDSVVIMVPGGTTGAALFPAHDYSPLANALTDKGYAFLLSNMRASYNNAYAEYGDAVKDIAAYVAYAKSKGYARIAILGISLGGPRMAQYVAERNDPAVKAVGFIASIPSPYLEFQVRSSEAERHRLEETLKHARELIAQGKGQAPELALPPNAQKIYDSLTASPQRDLVWVKGASHYLTPGPLAEAYARQTVEWLLKTFPASARQ